MEKNNDSLDLVKSLLLKDLESFYQKIESGELESGTNLMVLLKYIKEKKYFDDNFIEYWFIKILNNYHDFDLFILEKDNYDFFGFTAKDLSLFLENHCSFLIKKSSHQRVLSILKKGLENDCFFQNEYLNQFKESNIFQDDFDILMKKNITNFHNYLKLHSELGNAELDNSSDKKVKI